MEVSIGAALIVKNAEKTIHQAISPLQSVCSQIVVVDTGSTDSTPAICSRLGVELHFHLWQNDFSAARNYALSLMRTDWVLSIDADEAINPDDFLKINSLFTQEKIGGIQVVLRNFLNDKDLNYFTEHKYTRIFRNHRSIRYSGKIHEQIAESIADAGFEIIDTDFIINHYGYSQSNPEKQKRNLTLLRNELESNPNDDWMRFHLAETEFVAGNLNNAKLHYESALNSLQISDNNREMSRIRLAQIALKNNDFAKIQEILNFISFDINIEGLRQFILVTAHLSKGEFAKATSLLDSPAIASSSLIEKDLLEQSKELITMLSK